MESDSASGSVPYVSRVQGQSRRQPRRRARINPTIGLGDFLRIGTSVWERTFPFSSPYGRWTFNGRAALAAGLERLELPRGATILVPCYFQGAEIDTLLHCGFRLEFYRVDERLEADLDDIESRYEAGRTAALYVIHYCGFPQPLRALTAFAQAKGIPLIEDCALSLFSRDADDWLGTRGDMALYCVYKSLPLPHGGYLVTKKAGPDPALESPPIGATIFQTLDLMVERMRSYRIDGVERALRRATRLGRTALGWNRDEIVCAGSTSWDSRLLDYEPSRLTPFLMRLVDPSEVVRRRRANYSLLLTLLGREVGTPFPVLPAGVSPLFFPMLVADKVAFQKALAAKGIPSVNLWSDSHPACPPDMTAIADFWRRHILELPVHQELELEQIEHIAEIVKSLFRREDRVLAFREAGHPSKASFG